MNLQTPLLRLFYNYCNYFGVQFRPVSKSHWPSLANFVWNMSLNVAVIYSLLTIDPFMIRSKISQCNMSKPMFLFFSELSTLYIFPGVFFVDMVYFVKYALPVLQLLDSSCFQRFYQNERKSRTIFITVIGVNLFIFLTFLAIRLKNGLWNEKLNIIQNVMAYVCVFVIGFYQYPNCFLLHYYQHATFQALKHIETEITSSMRMSNEEEDAILRQIRTLARVNTKLNQMLSLPMVLYVVLHVFNIVLNTCVFMVCHIDTLLLFHSFIIWAYLAYLCGLNHQIMQTLKQIIHQLRLNYRNNAINNVFHPSTISSQALYYKSVKQTRQIRIEQMDLYSTYFRIKLFHMTTINFAFILQAILFILNYVVLITQTN